MTAPTTASRDDWSLHLARLINSLRPDWDTPGIRRAIHGARAITDKREDVAIAAIELTKRDDLRTPALLAQDGPHWHTGRTPDVRVVRARCDRPGHEYEYIPCRLCPHEHLEPSAPVTLAVSEYQAEINARGAALVLAALKAEPEPYTDHAMRAAGDREAS